MYNKGCVSCILGGEVLIPSIINTGSIVYQQSKRIIPLPGNDGLNEETTAIREALCERTGHEFFEPYQESRATENIPPVSTFK